MATPVLLVDDDADMRDCLTEVLREEGYQVIEAKDGAHALRLVEEGLSPCAIVIDHRMPGLTGGEFVETLAARSLVPTIPVVLITGDLKAPRPMRANLVLYKPFSAEALLDALRPHCQPPAVAA